MVLQHRTVGLLTGWELDKSRTASQTVHLYIDAHMLSNFIQFVPKLHFNLGLLQPKWQQWDCVESMHKKA